MSLSILHNAIDDWLLDNQRPFFNLKTDIMVIGAQEALSRRKPDLEAVTLVLAELSHRSNKAASNAKSHVQDRLEEINHQPIQWLLKLATASNFYLLKKNQTKIIQRQPMSF